MDKAGILIVEDDRAVRNLISSTLEVEGYAYHTAANGHEALLMAASYNPDVIILDLGLPDMDGIEIIKKVRGWSQKPIIVVSARSEDDDKIEALDCGADDYLTKPFSIPELLARLRVALRRCNDNAGTFGAQETSFKNGNLYINYEAGSVTMNGKELHLTPSEYKLLCALAKNAGKVLTNNFIQKEIWGGAGYSDSATLRVFIAGLRKKMDQADPGHSYIKTHTGIGYRMTLCEDE